MLTYNIAIIKSCLTRYTDIREAYQLIAAVSQNCPQNILPQDTAVVQRAVAAAEKGAACSAENISLCREVITEHAQTGSVDHEKYKTLLLNVSKNLVMLYKLNLLLFDKLLIGADMIRSSYLETAESIDSSLEEFYCDETEMLLQLPLKERMLQLGIDDVQQFWETYPQLLTAGELKVLLKAGLLKTVDDIISHQGKLYENEFSEEWEEYEYEYDKHRK